MAQLRDRSHDKKLTRKDRAKRPQRLAANVMVPVLLAGLFGWIFSPTLGILLAVTAAAGGIVAAVGRDLGYLRIHAAEQDALLALDPVRQGDVYPLNPATLAPENALSVVQEIIYRRPQRVLELGSGSSTLMIARCLKFLGGDRTLVSVDHHAEWLADTRNKIEAAGLGNIATLVHAPLTKHEGLPVPWYDVAELPADSGPFDVILVDGPEGGSSEPLARYGAYPVLKDRLAPGALLLVDDGCRSGERECVERWLNTNPKLDVRFISSKNGLWRVELPTS